jgi:hypothetical protein
VGNNSYMTGDGVALPAIRVINNTACVELLRGAQLGEKASRKPGGILGVISKLSSAFKRQGVREEGCGYVAGSSRRWGSTRRL